MYSPATPTTVAHKGGARGNDSSPLSTSTRHRRAGSQRRRRWSTSAAVLTAASAVISAAVTAGALGGSSSLSSSFPFLTSSSSPFALTLAAPVPPSSSFPSFGYKQQRARRDYNRHRHRPHTSSPPINTHKKEEAEEVENGHHHQQQESLFYPIVPAYHSHESIAAEAVAAMAAGGGGVVESSTSDAHYVVSSQRVAADFVVRTPATTPADVEIYPLLRSTTAATAVGNGAGDGEGKGNLPPLPPPPPPFAVVARHKVYRREPTVVLNGVPMVSNEQRSRVLDIVARPKAKKLPRGSNSVRITVHTVSDSHRFVPFAAILAQSEALRLEDFVHYLPFSYMESVGDTARKGRRDGIEKDEDGKKTKAAASLPYLTFPSSSTPSPSSSRSSSVNDHRRTFALFMGAVDLYGNGSLYFDIDLLPMPSTPLDVSFLLAPADAASEREREEADRKEAAARGVGGGITFNESTPMVPAAEDVAGPEKAAAEAEAARRRQPPSPFGDTDDGSAAAGAEETTARVAIVSESRVRLIPKFDFLGQYEDNDFVLERDFIFEEGFEGEGPSPLPSASTTSTSTSEASAAGNDNNSSITNSTNAIPNGGAPSPSSSTAAPPATSSSFVSSFAPHLSRYVDVDLAPYSALHSSLHTRRGVRGAHAEEETYLRAVQTGGRRRHHHHRFGEDEGGSSSSSPTPPPRYAVGAAPLPYPNAPTLINMTDFYQLPLAIKTLPSDPLAPLETLFVDGADTVGTNEAEEKGRSEREARSSSSSLTTKKSSSSSSSPPSQFPLHRSHTLSPLLLSLIPPDLVTSLAHPCMLRILEGDLVRRERRKLAARIRYLFFSPSANGSDGAKEEEASSDKGSVGIRPDQSSMFFVGGGAGRGDGDVIARDTVLTNREASFLSDLLNASSSYSSSFSTDVIPPANTFVNDGTKGNATTLAVVLKEKKKRVVSQRWENSRTMRVLEVIEGLRSAAAAAAAKKKANGTENSSVLLTPSATAAAALVNSSSPLGAPLSTFVRGVASNASLLKDLGLSSDTFAVNAMLGSLKVKLTLSQRVIDRCFFVTEEAAAAASLSSTTARMIVGQGSGGGSFVDIACVRRMIAAPQSPPPRSLLHSSPNGEAKATTVDAEGDSSDKEVVVVVTTTTTTRKIRRRPTSPTLEEKKGALSVAVTGEGAAVAEEEEEEVTTTTTTTTTTTKKAAKKRETSESASNSAGPERPHSRTHSSSISSTNTNVNSLVVHEVIPTYVLHWTVGRERRQHIESELGAHGIGTCRVGGEHGDGDEDTKNDDADVDDAGSVLSSPSAATTTTGGSGVGGFLSALLKPLLYPSDAETADFPPPKSSSSSIVTQKQSSSRNRHQSRRRQRDAESLAAFGGFVESFDGGQITPDVSRCFFTQLRPEYLHFMASHDPHEYLLRSQRYEEARRAGLSHSDVEAFDAAVAAKDEKEANKQDAKEENGGENKQQRQRQRVGGGAILTPRSGYSRFQFAVADSGATAVDKWDAEDDSDLLSNNGGNGNDGASGGDEEEGSSQEALAADGTAVADGSAADGAASQTEGVAEAEAAMAYAKGLASYAYPPRPSQARLGRAHAASSPSGSGGIAPPSRSALPILHPHLDPSAVFYRTAAADTSMVVVGRDVGETIEGTRIAGFEEDMGPDGSAEDGDGGEELRTAANGDERKAADEGNGGDVGINFYKSFLRWNSSTTISRSPFSFPRPQQRLTSSFSHAVSYSGGGSAVAHYANSAPPAHAYRPAALFRHFMREQPHILPSALSPHERAADESRKHFYRSGGNGNTGRNNGGGFSGGRAAAIAYQRQSVEGVASAELLTAFGSEALWGRGDGAGGGGEGEGAFTVSAARRRVSSSSSPTPSSSSHRPSLVAGASGNQQPYPTAAADATTAVTTGGKTVHAALGENILGKGATRLSEFSLTLKNIVGWYDFVRRALWLERRDELLFRPIEAERAWAGVGGVEGKPSNTTTTANASAAPSSSPSLSTSGKASDIINLSTKAGARALAEVVASAAGYSRGGGGGGGQTQSLKQNDAEKEEDARGPAFLPSPASQTDEAEVVSLPHSHSHYPLPTRYRLRYGLFVEDDAVFRVGFAKRFAGLVHQLASLPDTPTEGDGEDGIATLFKGSGFDAEGATMVEEKGNTQLSVNSAGNAHATSDESDMAAADHRYFNPIFAGDYEGRSSRSGCEEKENAFVGDGGATDPSNDYHQHHQQQKKRLAAMTRLKRTIRSDDAAPLKSLLPARDPRFIALRPYLPPSDALLLKRSLVAAYAHVVRARAERAAQQEKRREGEGGEGGVAGGGDRQQQQQQRRPPSPHVSPAFEAFITSLFANVSKVKPPLKPSEQQADRAGNMPHSSSSSRGGGRDRLVDPLPLPLLLPHPTAISDATMWHAFGDSSASSSSSFVRTIFDLSDYERAAWERKRSEDDGNGDASSGGANQAGGTQAGDSSPPPPIPRPRAVHFDPRWDLLTVSSYRENSAISTVASMPPASSSSSSPSGAGGSGGGRVAQTTVNVGGGGGGGGGTVSEGRRTVIPHVYARGLTMGTAAYAVSVRGALELLRALPTAMPVDEHLAITALYAAPHRGPSSPSSSSSLTSSSSPSSSTVADSSSSPSGVVGGVEANYRQQLQPQQRRVRDRGGLRIFTANPHLSYEWRGAAGDASQCLSVIVGVRPTCHTREFHPSFDDAEEEKNAKKGEEREETQKERTMKRHGERIRGKARGSSASTNSNTNKNNNKKNTESSKVEAVGGAAVEEDMFGSSRSLPSPSARHFNASLDAMWSYDRSTYVVLSHDRRVAHTSDADEMFAEIDTSIGRSLFSSSSSSSDTSVPPPSYHSRSPLAAAAVLPRTDTAASSSASASAAAALWWRSSFAQSSLMPSAATAAEEEASKMSSKNTNTKEFTPATSARTTATSTIRGTAVDDDEEDEESFERWARLLAEANARRRVGKEAEEANTNEVVNDDDASGAEVAESSSSSISSLSSSASASALEAFVLNAANAITSEHALVFAPAGRGGGWARDRRKGGRGRHAVPHPSSSSSSSHGGGGRDKEGMCGGGGPPPRTCPDRGLTASSLRDRDAGGGCPARGPTTAAADDPPQCRGDGGGGRPLRRPSPSLHHPSRHQQQQQRPYPTQPRGGGAPNSADPRRHPSSSSFYPPQRGGRVREEAEERRPRESEEEDEARDGIRSLGGGGGSPFHPSAATPRAPKAPQTPTPPKEARPTNGINDDTGGGGGRMRPRGGRGSAGADSSPPSDRQTHTHNNVKVNGKDVGGGGEEAGRGAGGIEKKNANVDPYGDMLSSRLRDGGRRYPNDNRNHPHQRHPHPNRRQQPISPGRGGPNGAQPQESNPRRHDGGEGGSTFSRRSSGNEKGQRVEEEESPRNSDL